MVAAVPMNSQSIGKMRRGFGLDPIKSDMPVGSAASILVHGGILVAALLAWQTAPRIMPEDVIAVDMVSDTPSVVGENTTAETAQVGVDTPTPSPLPEPLAPAPAEPVPAPTQATPSPPSEQVTPPSPAAPVPPPVPQLAPRPSIQPPPKPTQVQPAPAPKPAPAPQTKPKPAPKAQPQPQPKSAPAVRAGPRPNATAPPIEFDLAAASSAATGADSGGRRSPQLASRGQAGRLGKAGGGTQLTGDLEAALRSQIQPCWLEPANMSNPGSLLVVVSIDLGIDGRLLRDPVLVTPSSRAGASPTLVVAIDNALRAVRECAPFTLPPDRYESWKQVRFNFDPRRMARG
jgi:outer membrane biosynthesis protein TonB